jgi:hypothetical protein
MCRKTAKELGLEVTLNPAAAEEKFLRSRQVERDDAQLDHQQLNDLRVTAKRFDSKEFYSNPRSNRLGLSFYPLGDWSTIGPWASLPGGCDRAA